MSEPRKDNPGQAPKGANNRANAIIVGACVGFVFSMVGMAYAAVPLYALFCQVTGYGGTTQRVEQASDVVLDEKITVRFDANTANGLPWQFKPVQRAVTMNIGETVKIEYEAKNTSDEPVLGQATFNVTPLAAGAYFNKVECFCFTETELAPGEDLMMPVLFFVDPAIVDAPELDGVSTLTLSYTFYPHERDKPLAAVAKPDESAQSKL